MANNTKTTSTTVKPATPEEIASAKAVIDQYGLGDLWQGVYGLLLKGYTDANQILMMISTDSTPEGKQYQDAFFRRFPAIKIQRDENQRRIAKGEPPIPELSPSQYISNEQAYADAVSDIDPTLASNTNITAWLTGSGQAHRPVSPNEVRDRIDIARNYLYYSVNPDVRNQLRDIYGLSDSQMLNYVLSTDKQKIELEQEWTRNVSRANVGAQAASRGLDVSADLRNQIASNGYGSTFGDTASGFANVQTEEDTYAKLSAISGINSSRDDLIREQFDLTGGAAITNKKRALASQERARFSGSSAIGNNSLRVSGLGTQ